MKVGQNIKYDMIVLQNYGVQVKGKLFDTNACPLCIATGAPAQHGLPCRNLSALPDHPHRRTYRSQRQEPKEHARPSAGRRIPLRLRRCGRTLKLKNVLEKELKEHAAEHLFYEIEMPLVPVLVNIESNGVRIDTEALKQSSEHFTLRLQEIEKEIYALAGGETFNIGSPKQVGEVLFDRLKIVEKAKKTKTGQ